MDGVSWDLSSSLMGDIGLEGSVVGGGLVVLSSFEVERDGKNRILNEMATTQITLSVRQRAQIDTSSFRKPGKMSTHHCYHLKYPFTCSSSQIPRLPETCSW